MTADHKLRLWALALALAIFGLTLQPTTAQQVVIPGGPSGIGCAYNSTPPTVTTGNAGWVQCDAHGNLVSGSNTTYTLATNVNAGGSTTPVSNVTGASYIYSCVATTWNSASAQIQTLGPDGATYVSPASGALTANGSLGVVIGANATVRITVTGTPTGLYCNLS